MNEKSSKSAAGAAAAEDAARRAGVILLAGLDGTTLWAFPPKKVPDAPKLVIKQYGVEIIQLLTNRALTNYP